MNTELLILFLSSIYLVGVLLSGNRMLKNKVEKNTFARYWMVFFMFIFIYTDFLSSRKPSVSDYIYDFCALSYTIMIWLENNLFKIKNRQQENREW